MTMQYLEMQWVYGGFSLVTGQCNEIAFGLNVTFGGYVVMNYNESPSNSAKVITSFEFSDVQQLSTGKCI